MNLLYHADTIAAIATAPGEGSVGIVRISGPDALTIADQVFRCSGPLPSERESHTVVYGNVTSQGKNIDESLMIIMRGPRSYTAEDVVEIQGHGGSLCAKRILRCCVDAGARVAEAGEFTKRAFLNGRIDLLQAEAVLDLVRAQSERASSAALEQLDGGLSDTFTGIYEYLLSASARLEATLDFPEDELPEAILPEILADLSVVEQDLNQLLDTWEEGKLLREGALVVISGEPNVGKSTLMNAMLNTERAIVTDIPGTTRDTIEEGLVLDGIPVRLVDTAGLRETEDKVEKMGIERTRALVEKADFHIILYDVQQPIDVNTLEGKDPDLSLVILNKVDLAEPSALPQELSAFRCLHTSLIHSRGLSELKATLAARLSEHADLAARPQAVISERHRSVVTAALAELDIAKSYVEQNDDAVLVLAASQCRLALEQIGEATGKIYHEDLLDSVFSTFCIGK